MRLIRLLKRDLAKECSEWVSAGLISQDQAAKICERYGINYQDVSGQTYGYATLIGLAYLFIGLAVITLLSANWDDIPRAVRMSGLLLMTTATNLFAFKKYNDDKPSAAISLFFLGSLFYGASIMLIAQIYHIDEHFPDGILWWAMGVLPLALLLESSLLMALAMALSFTWFFVEVDLDYYPFLLPLFLAALGWHVFKVKHSYVLFLTFIAGLVLWSEYTLAWFMGEAYHFKFEAVNFIFGIGLFIALHGFSKWLVHLNDREWGDYGAILGLWTLRFALILLLVFSYQWPWEELIKAYWGDAGNARMTYILAIALSTVGVWLAYIGDKQFYATLAFALLYVFGVFLVTLIEDHLHVYALYFQIVTNIVLIMTAVFLIIRGIRAGVTHYFFVGVSVILLTGLLRYIDLVGDYIGAAILFIIFAVILLSAARFWKAHHQSQKAHDV